LQFYHKKTFINKIQTTHPLSLYFSFFFFFFLFLFFLFFYIHTTNYKNSKLNKNYIKKFKIYKRAFKTLEICREGLLQLQEQWQRISSTRRRHWRCVGSRATADEGGKTGGSGTSSSSLSPYAGSDLQRQQNCNNQLILVFISFVFFKSALVFFFFRSVPFLCLRPSLFVYLLPMADQMVAVVRGSRSW
jgi:hypothetical protein